MKRSDGGRRFARTADLHCGQGVKRKTSRSIARCLLAITERLEDRMLLSGVVQEQGNDVLIGDPLGSVLVDQWVPFVPFAEQTEIQAQSVADLTTVTVSLHFNSPGYRVSDWGVVKRDGNSFYIDAKVEQWSGPMIDLYQPTTLSHKYELGKLDPNTKYQLIFQSWDKAVETLDFSANIQTPTISITAQQTEIPEPLFGTDGPIRAAEVIVTRTGPTIGELDVHLKLGGTATLLKDYEIGTGLLGAASDLIDVWIPAGQASARVFVIPLEDQLVEGNETVELKLAPSDAYTIGAPEAATITILDSQPELVPYVPTPEQTSIAISTQAGTTTAKVTLDLWDLVYPVTDWGKVQLDGNTFIVDAKVMQKTGPVPLPLTSNFVKPPPMVHEYPLGAMKPGSYSFVFRAWGQKVQSQSFTVPAPVELPVVTIKATDPTATEPDPRRMGPMPSPWDPGTFTITRTGSTDLPLKVQVTIGGTAGFPADYNLSLVNATPLLDAQGLDRSSPAPWPLLIIIPAGEASTDITLYPAGDNLVEGDETVVMTLIGADGYNVRSPASDTVTIKDTPVDQWIAYTPTAEQTSINLKTVDGTANATVNLWLWDREFRVTDWGTIQQDGNRFIVDAKVEQNTGPLPKMPIPIDLPPIAHDYALGMLKPGSYSFVFNAWGKTVEVQEFKIPTPVELPVVTITASDPIAREPDAPGITADGQGADIGRYTITRTGPTDRPLLVNLKVSGTATEGLDYRFPYAWLSDLVPPTPGQVPVVIPAGESSATLDVTPLADNLVEGDETVILTIIDGADYDVGKSSAATVTIQDATADRWVSYIPTAQQTDLAVQTLAGITSGTVTLKFGSPGFEVRDWGTVKQTGSEFIVDAKVERWTGPVPMVIPLPVTHQYEFGSLKPGEYSFTFKAWGQTIESVTFKVEGSTLPTVSVVADAPVASEPIRGGKQPKLGSFKVMRVGPTDVDLKVHLKTSGTATRGGDYLFGAFDTGPFVSDIDVVIPAGHSWVPISVLARADAEVEGVETVILTVTPTDAYSVGVHNDATVRILDTPTPILRVRDRMSGNLKDLPAALPTGSDKLDVADNELIISVPEGETLTDTLAFVNDLVRSGRNDGSWTGVGITSSAAAKNKQTGLAVIPDEQTGSIRIKHALNGDANLDGVIDAADYFLIDSGFITQKGGYRNGDLNYDGIVDAADYFLVDSAFIGQDAPLDKLPQPMQEASPPPATTSNAPATGITAKLFSTEPLLEEYAASA